MSETAPTHDPDCIFPNPIHQPNQCGGCEYARMQRWAEATHITGCLWLDGYDVCCCDALRAAYQRGVEDSVS